MASIQAVQARQILDSRGNPTVECEIQLSDGSTGRAAVPSGASTGSREELELRDEGFKYLGRGVSAALSNIHFVIAPEISGFSGTQKELDDLLIALDGTDNKSKLGVNAILAVSMAFAVATAESHQVPLFNHIHTLFDVRPPALPRPLANIMNGGAHANWTTDIQEYMIIPRAEDTFVERMRKVVEVYQHLGELIKKRGLSTNVGNEGGYAPELNSNEEAFELILEAITIAGFTVGENEDFVLGIDAAASEFFRDGHYELRRDGTVKSTEEMIAWLKDLTRQYPLYIIEDGLAESDWAGWHALTEQLGQEQMILGDDLLVTNVKYIERAVREKSCNALLVKLNQVGTVSETLDAMRMALENGWEVVPSHRSGETEDTFLSHFAVGTGAGWIKTGAPSRTDRTAKYNELLRIAEEMEEET